MTEDEKDKLLTGGSGVQYGKFRIEKFFKGEHTEKEKIAFLKNEYGTGGQGRSGFNEWHDAKGISYKKGSMSTPDCEAFLKWNEVSQRIDRLIAEGRYVTQKDIDERIKDAKACKAFCRNLGKGTPIRPTFSKSDNPSLPMKNRITAVRT